MKYRRPESGQGWVSGMTLVEIMVGLGIASLAGMSMMAVYVTSNRSFATMSNYVTMDQTSRLALDQMTRDIRKSKNLVSFATNQLVFNFDGTNSLVYAFDPASRQLTQWRTGGATNVLLSECDSLRFSMYRNVPNAGGAFAATTDPNYGKSITVAWRCSRTILNKKATTEDMQQALIVIRNKPVP